MNPTPLTRRQALAAAGTVGIATLGAGFGRLLPSDPAATRPGLRLDFRVDRDPTNPADPGPEAPPPAVTQTTASTPTPTPTPTGGATGRRRDRRDAPVLAGGANVGGALAAPRQPVVSSPPLSLDGVVPGDAGTLTATLTVSDAPAGLWLRADASGVENGRVEPETAAGGGDGDEGGELADAVAVTLWFDGDADGRADADETLYEGSLAGLADLASGVPVADCLAPGTHRVRLRWSLPTTATNAVQTDRAAFGLDFAATACDGANPFAA